MIRCAQVEHEATLAFNDSISSDIGKETSQAGMKRVMLFRTKGFGGNHLSRSNFDLTVPKWVCQSTFDQFCVYFNNAYDHSDTALCPFVSPKAGLFLSKHRIVDSIDRTNAQRNRGGSRYFRAPTDGEGWSASAQHTCVISWVYPITCNSG